MKKYKKVLCQFCEKNYFKTDDDFKLGICKQCRDRILRDDCEAREAEQLKEDAEEMAKYQEFETEPLSGRNYPI